MTLLNTEKIFLTKQEVADLLACKVSTVEKWIKDGRLHTVNMGSRLTRIPAQEVEAFIRDLARR
mgnify:CR=1 FL=1